MTETINPLPAAGSNFLEVLNAFLAGEDAERFALQFAPFVAAGGLHGLVAGLTATPSALTAFPGGFYTTESGSITYADNSTTWVICDSGTAGDAGGFTRIPGTHYLTSVVNLALPAGTLRLMTVTTAGGAITGVVDDRVLSPLATTSIDAHVRLHGTETLGADMRLVERAGHIVIQLNTSTTDFPVWDDRFDFQPGGFPLTLISGATQARTLTFPDKDDTLATLSDIGGSSFPAGTRLLFDNDAAPAGWTRILTQNDVIPRIVSGVRADGGSWTISGLSVGGHTHTLSAHTHTLDFLSDVAYNPGSNLRIITSATSAPSPDLTGSTSTPISSDGSWRPLHRDVILCEKS